MAIAQYQLTKYQFLLDLEHGRVNNKSLRIWQALDGDYQLQIGEPFWMPEIGLGIGRCVLPSDRFKREVLSWFDEKSDRYITPEERSERLAARLKELGEDPDLL